ncbi:MAG TPA: hypothetical protein VIO86_10020 [Candidatus Dormibacteraeota bacterium]
MTADKTGPASSNAVTWAGVLVGGLVLALVAQFLLDSFADSSTMGHWTQHALLFWSGLMTGAGVLRLYQLGSRAA